MPIKRRITKELRGYGQGHLTHYFFGWDFFGNGFGREDTPEVQAEMLAAWPQCREAVMELARERSRRRGFIKLPAFWWVYDSPVGRDRDITEEKQLTKLGLDASVILFG